MNGTTAERTYTKGGRRVNRYSNLCESCSNGVAQSAVHFALGDTGLSDTQRLRLIKSTIRRDVASCVQNCGRTTERVQ